MKFQKLKIKNKIATILSFFIVVSIFLFPAVSVFAFATEGGNVKGGATEGGNVAPAKTFTLQNPLKVDSLAGLIQAFLEVFTYIVILFAVLALVYVGLQFILARGNSDRMKELKNWLLYIVIGVAVVIGARIIVSIVINTLGASGVVDQGIIQSANNAIGGK